MVLKKSAVDMIVCVSIFLCVVEGSENGGAVFPNSYEERGFVCPKD